MSRDKDARREREADPRDERGESDQVAGETFSTFGAASGEAVADKPLAQGLPSKSEAKKTRARSTGRGAFLVGAGILLSRIVGVIRQRVFAYFLGNSDAMDAFNAAFRIPNFLQNVFGEGALSASFIPVYAKLLAPRDGETQVERAAREEEADRVAWSVFTLLALVVSVLVLVGVLSTPLLINAIAMGFEGEKRDLTERLVRIFFPGAGLLVLSAWCLGVLNSHRRFFLSYTAPVVWNIALIAALAWAGWPSRPVPLSVFGG